MAEDVKTVLTHTVNTISNLTDVVKDLKLTVYDYNIKPLKDPGLYTAFEVTATDTKKTQKITVLLDGAACGSVLGVLGDYDVYVDWGDGSITSGKPVKVTSFTGDNQYIWKNLQVSYFGQVLALDRYDVNYTHTYETAGTYKIKIIGTTYYHFRCNNEATNIISRCLLNDLPLYSGLKRLQGAFGKSKYLTRIYGSPNYVWPDFVVDMYGTLEDCTNLTDVGNLTLPSNVLGVMHFLANTKIKTGIYIPDSVINALGFYANCKLLLYAPNTGANNRALRQMFYYCLKLMQIGGLISAKTKNGYYAFFAAKSLFNTPVLNSSIVWNSSDGEGDNWKKGFLTNYTDTNCLLMMFAGSAITTAPLLGTIQPGITGVNCSNMFSGCSNLKSLPKIPLGAGNCMQVFVNCSAAVSCHSTSGIADVIPSTATNMDGAFSGCTSLRNAPTIPQSVTTAKNCFFMCKSLLSITPFVLNGVYSITDASKMFYRCLNLKQVNSPLPSSITNLKLCFCLCYLLSSISWKTVGTLTNATDMSYMFQNCKSLQRVYGIIPSSVVNTSHMFEGCTQLKMAPGFYTDNSNCTNMARMYYGCYSLTSITNTIIPKSITEVSQAFYECNNLSGNISKIIPHSFTSENAINVQQLFKYCSNLYGSLTLVIAVGNKLWNSGKTFTNTSAVFLDCSDLIRIYIPTTWGGLKAV